MKRYGFTLIELLIVVAIIAILAAIAVPNFLEAQTRAKVSRTQADMRSLATAVETYIIDHNRTPTVLTGYPGSLLNGPSVVNPALPGIEYSSYRFRRLTTPVAYISTIFPEVFTKDGKSRTETGATSTYYDAFDYFDDRFDLDLNSTTNKRYFGLTSGANWRIASCGPDNIQTFGGAQVGNSSKFCWDYDATNGTISRGDIIRIGSGPGKVGNNLPAIDRVKNVVNDPAIKP